MERDKSVFRPPQEYFTIAGMTFNILGILQARERLTLYSNRMRPGDREAQLFLRHLTNAAVSPEEYVTVMPRLLEYATKKEGGFDGDFLRVAEYFIGETTQSLGGDDLTYLPRDRRLVLLSNAYGKLQAIKGTIWHDPKTAHIKADLIRKANDYIKHNWDVDWSD